MRAKPVRTSSPSATRSTQRSGAGSPRSAATSRPFGASRVVVPTSRSRSTSTSSQVSASTPSMIVVHRSVLAVEQVARRLRLQPLLDVDEQPAAVARQRHLGPRLLVGEVGEARRRRWRARRRGGATRRCGGSRPPRRRPRPGRGSACRRSRVPSGSQATDAGPGVRDGVGEERAGRRRRAPGGWTARRRRWRCRRPRATPSGDGSYQSIARGDLAGRVGGVDQDAARARRRARRSDGRRAPARSRSPQRSIVNSWSPRTAGDSAVPAAVSSASRSRNRPRAGTASRAARVRSFWAVVHARTSDEVPSSSQRYGSATSIPWRTSVGPSARVAGGGGTSARAAATSCGRGWACGRGWPSSCEPGGWPSSCAST